MHPAYTEMLRKDVPVEVGVPAYTHSEKPGGPVYRRAQHNGALAYAQTPGATAYACAQNPLPAASTYTQPPPSPYVDADHVAGGPSSKVEQTAPYTLIQPSGMSAYGQPSVIIIQQPQQAAASAPVVEQNVNVSVAQAVATNSTAEEVSEIDLGWFLCILGLVVGPIPWFIGAGMLCCNREKVRQSPIGYIVCTVAVFLIVILVIVIVAINLSGVKSSA